MKKIYSLNLAAWLVSQGYNYHLHEDEDTPGKYYFVFENDVTEAKEEYKRNRGLQKFLNTYKQLKKEIFNLRNTVRHDT
jgi:hypothetical protein